MIINFPNPKLNSLPAGRIVRRLGFSSKRPDVQKRRQKRSRVQTIKNSISSTQIRYQQPDQSVFLTQKPQPPRISLKELLRLSSSSIINNPPKNLEISNRSHKSITQLYHQQSLLNAAIGSYQKNHHPTNCSLSPEKFLTERASDKKLGNSLNLISSRSLKVEIPRLPKTLLPKITKQTPIDHYERILVRNKQEYQSSKCKVMLSLSLENTKRLKKLIACKEKQRAFRRWQTQQSTS